MRSKSIFLLVIFLLNTVVGFACAVGMERDTDQKNHIHTSSKKRNHEHHHQHKGGHAHKPGFSKGLNLSEEESCCKTLVNELMTQGKLIPQSGKIQVILPVLLLPGYHYSFLILPVKLNIDKPLYARQRERPPNRDIRITINSFQI